MPQVTDPIINDERAMRLKKLQEFEVLGINPFPARVERKHTIAEALALKEGAKVRIAGRIMLKRDMGKLTFAHLMDESGRMQIALKKDDLGEETYNLFIKKIDVGDFISVSGGRFVTHTGEESVLVKEWTLLTKAILPLPDKFHGVQDEEMRLRKRYLDILFHPELKAMFRRKALFWQSMREFFIQEGFLEVETPVLETTTGGADATPFVTHHKALDIDVYLRISNGELWQKRLMVAGFEKTFEIGRQFRNEGISREHLQDYSQMEFYWAYADYEKGMELVERMYKHVIKKTFGTLKFDIGEFTGIDFEKSWGRIDYQETVKKYTGIDVVTASLDDIRRKLKELNIVFEDYESRGRLVDCLWKYCRKKVKGPVFLVNVPVVVSPLAKRTSDNPELTERYQVIIAGSEIGNGYSELNDPLDQAARFEEQRKMLEAGDTEAQMFDYEFVEALEHGMPPTTGFGVSERLFSFLENKPIRECVLFPLVRPAHTADTNKNDTKQQPIVQRDTKPLSPLPMNRDEAFMLLKKHHVDEADFAHYLESEAVMRALARRLGRDDEYWGMLGLLHDIDWGQTKHDDRLHLTKAPDMLREAGFPEDFIDIIISHGYGCICANLQDKTRNCEIQYALACAETVTGLIHAAARLRPDKIATLEAGSVLKKFKDKKFAAKVNREFIKECENLGLSLEEFLQLAIEAIRGIAPKVGL